MDSTSSLSPSFSKVIGPFRQSLKRSRLTAASVEYPTDVAAIDTRLTALHNSGLLEATTERIVDYIETMRLAGAKSSSIARRISSMRKFFNFCVRKGYRADNPIDPIRQPKVKRVADLSRLLTAEQLQAIFDASDGTEEYPAPPEIVQRNRVILMTVSMTPVSIKYLIALTMADADLILRGQGLILVNKAQKEVRITFPPDLLEEWQKYLKKYRDDIVLDRAIDYVFVSRHRNSSLSRQCPWQMLQRRAQKLGFIRKVSMHDLRRTFLHFNPLKQTSRKRR